MEPELVNTICTAAGFFFSMLSFYIVISATRKQSESITYAAVMGRLLEINQLEVNIPRLFEILHTEFSEEALEENGGALRPYLFMVLNLYAEVHVQHTKYGLLDEEQFRIWKSRLENDFHRRPFLRGYWRAEMKGSPNEYSKGFKAFVEDSLANTEKHLRTTGEPITDTGVESK